MLLKKLLSPFLALFILFSAAFGYGGVVDIHGNLYKAPQIRISGCKNVILLIGDGMGFNSIEKTKHDLGIELPGFDAFTVRGESQTASASSTVTDSAAGGTALACGVRTVNSFVGVFPLDRKGVFSHPMNLPELAISNGKLAGVITTDQSSGATPASFTVHTSDRSNEADITAQQLESSLTLIWGLSTPSFSASAAEKNGFEVIENRADMLALSEGSRSFGQFTDEVFMRVPAQNMPTLTEMTEKAIDLLDDDPDGFFLMVEAAHIDKCSHSNLGEYMTDALASFDQTLSYVLDYAEASGNTLVVVTADHETGGITWNGSDYVYTATDHTGVNVPILVYGSDQFMDNGEVMPNCEVSRRIAIAMGQNRFPVRCYVSQWGFC